MTSKLHLTVPKEFENARAQVSILGQDLSVQQSTTLKAAAAGIDLEPGIYAARAVLADGHVLQAAFKLAKGKKKAVVELTAMPSLSSSPSPSLPSPDAESDAGQGGFVPESAILTSLTNFDAQLRFETPIELVAAPEPPSLSLVSLGLDGTVRTSGAPVLQDPAGKIVVSPEDSIRFVRALYPAGELFVAAPTSHAEQATLTFSPGNPGDVQFDLQDDDADLMLAYLGSRRVEQLSRLVEDYWGRSRELLRGKYKHPVAAAVGAYVMVLVGSPNQDEGDCSSPGNWLDQWTGNLFGDFPWLIDGLCIRGEVLARRGAHEEAIRLFCMLPERGLPMFTFGFRFALDRLSGYRNAAAKGLLAQGHLQRIEAVLEPLQRLAVTVDFQRPVLSFWRPAPNAAPARAIVAPQRWTLSDPGSAADLTRAAEAAATTTLPATRRSPMGEALERGRRRGARAVSNEEFLQRLMARRPEAEVRYRGMLESARRRAGIRAGIDGLRRGRARVGARGHAGNDRAQGAPGAVRHQRLAGRGQCQDVRRRGGGTGERPRTRDATRCSR